MRLNSGAKLCLKFGIGDFRRVFEQFALEVFLAVAEPFAHYYLLLVDDHEAVDTLDGCGFVAA
jgi:hypothetical protein